MHAFTNLGFFCVSRRLTLYWRWPTSHWRNVPELPWTSWPLWLHGAKWRWESWRWAMKVDLEEEMSWDREGGDREGELCGFIWGDEMWGEEDESWGVVWDELWGEEDESWGVVWDELWGEEDESWGVVWNELWGQEDKSWGVIWDELWGQEDKSWGIIWDELWGEEDESWRVIWGGE